MKRNVLNFSFSTLHVSLCLHFQSPKGALHIKSHASLSCENDMCIVQISRIQSVFYSEGTLKYSCSFILILKFSYPFKGTNLI